MAEGDNAVLHTVIEGLRLRDALPPSNMMPRGSWSSISSLEMESKAEYGGLLEIFKASDLGVVYITSPAPYLINHRALGTTGKRSLAIYPER